MERLAYWGEGRREQDLVFLPDWPYPGLRRPHASLAGLLTDLRAFIEIFVYPGMDELVQPADFTRPAGCQG